MQSTNMYALLDLQRVGLFMHILPGFERLKSQVARSTNFCAYCVIVTHYVIDVMMLLR